MFHFLLVALALVFDAVLHRSPGSLQCAKLNTVEYSDHKLIHSDVASCIAICVRRYQCMMSL